MAVKGLNFRISGTNAAGPALNQLNNQLQTVQRTTTRMAPLQASWNKGLNENRRMVQQLGFQIGDFASQIAGGQNAMLAFVQQGGQVLQFFGPFGAVAAAALAVFGSLGLAMYKSGVAASQVTPVLGVLRQELEWIVSSLQFLGNVFIWIANLIVNNVDVIVIALGILAGRYLAGVTLAAIGASNAVRAFIFTLYMAGPAAAGLMAVQGALLAVRAVLMTLLPYALLIGLAVIIQRLWALRQATGSWGEVFKLVYALIAAAVRGMAQSIQGLGYFVQAVANLIAAAFFKAIAAIIERWDAMVQSMASGFNSLMEFAGLEKRWVPEASEALTTVQGLAKDFAESSVASSKKATGAWQAAAKGIGDAWKPIADLMGEDIDVRDWFGGGGGDGKGKGGGGKSPADKLSEEAKRIKEIYGQISESISSTMLSGFKEVVKGAKSLKDYALESLNSVLDAAQDVLLSPIFDAVGKWAGGWLVQALGFPQYDFGGPSFAGGGYTGNGSRTGGMDGKGGFMAMLHPNETVVDHTKGGGAGGQVVVRMVVEEAEGFASRVGNISQQSAIGVVAQFERKRLSAAVQRAQAKPRVK